MILSSKFVMSATAACLIGIPAFERPAQGGTEADPETIVIRQQPMKVWPAEQLREMGFDIPEVPREDNAFWVYLEAVNAYKYTPDEVSEAFDYAIDETWPTSHDEKLKAFLLDEANQKAMSLFRRASGMEQYQPYYFGESGGSIISVLLPSLSNYRHLSKMLVADGHRLEAEGAPAKAMDNYIAAMRGGHHAAQGVTLIESLVGVACWSLGDRAAQQLVLRNPGLSAAQLRKLLGTLQAIDPLRPTVARGLAAERMFGGTIVDEWTTRPHLLLRNVAALGSGGVGLRAVQQADGWSALEARVGRLLLPDRTVKKHMHWYYDQLIDLVNKPAYDPARQQFDEEAAVMSIPRWNLIARVFLPSLTRACTIGERCRMQTLATRLAAALRLYAAEHDGQPPNRLDELHDLIASEDLIDPFSGRQFVYRPSRGAWLFYSFSENLIDDGGKMDTRFAPDFVVAFPPSEPGPFQPED